MSSFRHWVCVTGDKGGVGKSFTARAIVDFLEDTNQSFKAFDTDRTNATLFRFYPDHVHCIDVEQPADLDRFLTELSESNSTYLMDCAARTLDSMLKWIKDIDLFSIREELGIKITLVFLLGPEKDCVQILSDIVNEFGSNVNYLIVKNLSRGKNFDIYDQSTLRKKLIKELNAREFDLPSLLEKTALQIDRGNIPWSSADRHSSLQIADRQRVKVFRSKVRELLREGLSG